MKIPIFPKGQSNGKPKSPEQKLLDLLLKLEKKMQGTKPSGKFKLPEDPLVDVPSNEVSLRADHWDQSTSVAKFHVNLAANNSPPMKTGSGHSPEAIILVKRAYNRIRVAPNLAQYPPIAETGIYDIETSVAIGKFQSEFGLTVDGVAGNQTLSTMDNQLLAIEQGTNVF